MDENLKRKTVEVDEGAIEKARGWSNLPVEIKFQILKNLDFKSRLRFRAVSSSDRRLIDSQRLRVDFLQLYDFLIAFGTECGCMTFPHNWSRYQISPEQEAAMFSLTAYIRRVGKIEELTLMHLCYVLHPFESWREEFAKNPVQVERFVCEESIAFPFLPFISCRKILLNCVKRFDCLSLLELPVIREAQDVFFDAPCPKMTVCKVIGKWIENDAAIGTHFQTKYRKSIMPKVEKEWSERIIPNRGQDELNHMVLIIKIRTDNVEKMILVEDDEPIVQCVVVPSNLDIDDEKVYLEARDTYLCPSPSL